MIFRILLLIIGAAAAIYGSYRALVSIDLRRGIEVKQRTQSRFALVDFFALFAMLQIPLLLIAAIGRFGGANVGEIVVWGGLYTLLYAGIWWWGVQALSDIGVQSNLRRALFLGVLQPIGMVLVFTVLALSLFVLSLVLSGSFWLLTGRTLQDWPPLVGLIGVGFAIWLYSLACDWIRAGRTEGNLATRTSDDEAKADPQVPERHPLDDDSP